MNLSVPLSKRTLSELQVFQTALDLRLKLTNLLLRDFGVKDKIRNLVAASGMVLKGISKEDYKTLDAIYRKYDIGRPFIDQYPKWLLDYFRTNILEILKNLIWNITAANTIYAVRESEVDDRRRFQTHAIINCEQLLQEMQYIIYVVPTDIRKLMPFVEMIKTEIKMLKSWRKDCNRILKAIKEAKEKKKKKEAPAEENSKTDSAAGTASVADFQNSSNSAAGKNNNPISEAVENELPSVGIEVHMPEDRYDKIYDPYSPDHEEYVHKEPPIMNEKLMKYLTNSITEKVGKKMRCLSPKRKQTKNNPKPEATNKEEKEIVIEKTSEEYKAGVDPF